MQIEKIELIIQDSENGNIIDISEIVGKVTTSKSINNSAGKCSFSIDTNIHKLSFSMGSTVMLKVKQGGKWFPKFFGFIFATTPSGDSLEITAYDQLKYLSNTETYVLTNQTHESIIKRIGLDFDLRLGSIEGRNYILPERIEDEVALGDIIQRAMDYTLTGTGYHYIIRDEFGYLCCRELTSLVTNLIIGENSLLSSYSFKQSIEDSYDRIKLYQDNEDTGTRQTYIAQDSEHMAKWGVLQLKESVDENMNAEQIKQRAEDLLKYHNKIKNTLTLTINGILSLEAGSGIYLHLNDIPNNYLEELFLISKIDDTYDNGIHTCKLEVQYD